MVYLVAAQMALPGKMTDVLIVLGMHRSGTSAVAGVLAKLGVSVPKTLYPGDYGNERGYFESTPIMIFHDELLASAGTFWCDWRAFSPAWYDSPAFKVFKSRARTLFENEFGDAAVVIFKDPRVCRFLPFWLDVFSGMNVTPHVVVPVRSPLEVANSLEKRNSLSLQQGMLLWLRHVLDAEAASRALPRSFFIWGNFVSNWRATIDKISTDINLPWPRLTGDVIAEVGCFLSADLVHNTVPDAELAACKDVHQWIVEAYESCKDLARDFRSSASLARMDRIRKSFDESSDLFGPILADGEAKSQTLHYSSVSLRAELSAKTIQLDSAIAQNTNVIASLASNQSETKALARRLAAANARSIAEAGAIARLSKEIQTLRRQWRLAEDATAALHERARSEALHQNEVIYTLRAKLIDAEATVGYLERQRATSSAPLIRASLASEKRGIVRRLARSGLFDSQWYLAKYEDANQFGLTPVEHYLENGFRKGYLPNPFFDTRWYLMRNDDVRRSGINPLFHYLVHGHREGRDPSPHFQTSQYLESNPCVRASGINPLAHFLAFKRAEGQLPTPGSSTPETKTGEEDKYYLLRLECGEHTACDRALDPKTRLELNAYDLDGSRTSGALMTEIQPFVPLSARACLLTLGTQPHLQKGLEFGALNHPVVQPGQGDVRFVDYTSTENLRNYPHAASIDKSRIVDVDYIWSGSGSLAEVINTGERFDYAIASHVIEHVPNMVGWFQGIADVLKPGAIFNLAIPDKRFTFDVRRKLTTLGELVEAHLLQYSHPSIRQVFDHCYDAVAIAPGSIWRQQIDIDSVPRLCGNVALQLAYESSVQISKTHRYYDSHCLIVTPLSFLRLIEGLSRLNLFPLILKSLHPTTVGEFEFFVSFEMPEEMPRPQLLERQLAILSVQQEKLGSDARAATLSVDAEL